MTRRCKPRGVRPTEKTEDGLWIVRVVPDGPTGVKFDCPWCCGEHVHGVGSGLPGQRVSHCRLSDIGGIPSEYVIAYEEAS
jgi:hypothetical protein